VSVELACLDNGLTVISQPRPEVETVSLGIWVGAGSRSEIAAEHGIAHFLEHMAFKGTKRRRARDIAEEIEAVGGEINAATGIDSTAYFARVHRQDLALAVDLLSDIILNPIFDPTETDREREVILQEIAAALDQPDDIVFDFAQETAFPNQSVGRSILGTPSSVKRVSRESLGGYLKAHYHAPDMVLAAAGAVEHDALVALAERHLSALDPRPAQAPDPAHYRGGIRRAVDDFEQLHLVLGFEAPGFSHPDYYVAQICASALGGGMSSRLFQEVRERRALCYAIHAFASPLADSGMLSVYAASGPDRAHELLAVVRDELERAAEGGFSEQEISRVKAQAKMGLFATMESSSARAEQLARQVLIWGHPFSTEELLDKVERVSAEDIKRFLQEKLVSPVSLATVGPILDVARFDGVAAKFTIPAAEAA
jgi:predicted Zn-dependent peptidase